MNKKLFAVIGDDTDGVDYAEQAILKAVDDCVKIKLGEPLRRCVSALLGGADELFCKAQANKPIPHLNQSPANLAAVIEEAINNIAGADLRAFLAFRRVQQIPHKAVLLSEVTRPVELKLAQGLKAVTIYVARPRKQQPARPDPLVEQVNYLIENTSLAQVKLDVLAIIKSVTQPTGESQ